jgi:hypothetical protein
LTLDYPVQKLRVSQPKMYIAETGWPTGSKDVSNESNGFGSASIEGLQVGLGPCISLRHRVLMVFKTFLDTFVCKANQDNIGYFFFEASVF